MKKLIIASLVGGLILFIWQFLSWSLLGVHTPNLAYTPNQDKVLELLGDNLEEGSYFLPTVKPGTSAAEEQALTEKMIGKPWAIVSYHKEFTMNLGYNMGRGYIIDFLVVLLLSWMLMKFRDLSFMSAIIASLSVGIIGYLSISYLESIWFEGNTIPYLIDTIVSWGLVGVWLGFWLTKR